MVQSCTHEAIHQLPTVSCHKTQSLKCLHVAYGYMTGSCKGIRRQLGRSLVAVEGRVWDDYDDIGGSSLSYLFDSSSLVVLSR